MSSTESPESLISESQIFAWRHRVREIDETIRTLEAERTKLGRLIEMAQMLEREAKLLDAAGESANAHPKSIGRTLSGLTSKDTFPTAVHLVVEREEDGVSYEQVREAIMRSPLGGKLRKSDKGFYHALARGKEKGILVEHKGYVFTPANLDAFKRKVAAGLKQDKNAPASLGSPMMDALLEVIALEPGMTAKEAIERVSGGSEKHNLPPLKNLNSAYNAVARLKQRGEIEGYGHLDRQLRLGPKAPDQFQRLARSGVVVPMVKTNTAVGQ
jgi:hypothetical protein